LADAAAAREKAADVRADADKAGAEISAERDRLIAEARISARTERANLLAQSLGLLTGAVQAYIFTVMLPNSRTTRENVRVKVSMMLSGIITKLGSANVLR
jgi:hypothetical protein